MYPGVGEGVLYAEEVKHFCAQPDGPEVAEEGVCRAFFFGAVEEEGGEADIHTLVVGQAEGVPVALLVGRTEGQA